MDVVEDCQFLLMKSSKLRAIIVVQTVSFMQNYTWKLGSQLWAHAHLIVGTSGEIKKDQS